MQSGGSGGGLSRSLALRLALSLGTSPRIPLGHSTREDAVTADSAIRMIVNADDLGYFDEVSRGILHCAEAGVVTATGVMANGPAFEKWVGNRRALPSLSVGVHLNATLGRPLTAEMRDELSSPRKEFPLKGALAAMLLRGRVAVSTVIHGMARTNRSLRARRVEAAFSEFP